MIKLFFVVFVGVFEFVVGGFEGFGGGVRVRVAKFFAEIGVAVGGLDARVVVVVDVGVCGVFGFGFGIVCVFDYVDDFGGDVVG